MLKASIQEDLFSHKYSDGELLTHLFDGPKIFEKDNKLPVVLPTVCRVIFNMKSGKARGLDDQTLWGDS